MKRTGTIVLTLFILLISGCNSSNIEGRYNFLDNSGFYVEYRREENESYDGFAEYYSSGASIPYSSGSFELVDDVIRVYFNSCFDGRSFIEYIVLKTT